MKTLSTAVRLLFSGALVWSTTALQAATYYVAPTGSDSNAGSSASPFLTIQKGVDTAAADDTVLVSPGIYATGGRTPSGSCASRVVIEKNVTVRSLHGAAQTVIQGQPNSTTSAFGAGSVRCVYMTAGTLDGFSLLNGYADASAPPTDRDNPRINGGGVYAPVNNRAPQVNNCIIAFCGGYRGGGAYWTTLNNCTVVSNYVNTTSGDGVWGSLVRNSIVMFNGDENYSSAANSVDSTLFTFSCTTPAPGLNNNGVSRDGGNNITNDPIFVSNTFIPSTYSPCINAGNNAYVSGDRDAAGNARILEGTVDIGAYESTYILFPLTVNNGTGDGSYLAGTVVPIVADTAPAWTHFTGWVGDVTTVANTNAASTTLIMQPSAMTVTATYSTLNLPEVIANLLGVPLPVTISNITVDCIGINPPEVRLGPVANNDIAFFTTVYTNAGTLISPWRVSSEEGYDKLALVVDGVETASISGEFTGVVTQFVAGAGAHLIQWIYSKDESGYDGQDAGWVGAPTWIPDALSTELGVPGKPVAFPYGQPGSALPFPYGFEGCFVDTTTNLPTGAIGGAAVRLGGLTNGVPLVGNSQTSGVEVVLNGSGSLSFHWRTSCQGSDFLFCYIDGVEAARLSNTKSNVWATFSTNLLTVGAHTVRWAYGKNASGFDYKDCGWIDSVTWAQFSYLLTVENGSGDGNYPVGQVVTVTANPPPAGEVFDVWDGDTEGLADPTSPTTTLVMPGRDITVRALYKVKTLSVTVINGRDAGAWPNEVHESTGEPEGEYPAGALVRIVAEPAPLWQTFDRWTSVGGAIFSNEFADVSIFVMPTNDVTVTANFRPQTDAEKLAGALTIRGQPLTISSFSPSGVVAEATGGIRYGDPVVKMGGPSVGPNQSVSLTTTNFTGNGYLLFWWRADSEAEYDGVRLEVNGTPRTKIYSEKNTNSTDKVVWYLYAFALPDVTNITWRFTRDDTYYVHNNMVLLDRVTWIPEGLVNALDAGACIPNINAEYDPEFKGRMMSDGEFTFEGEDGGVQWVHDAPGGGDAIRLGNFGYVTNGQLAQVSITNFSTGILTWEWTSRSEGVYDALGFYFDGIRTNWISGKGDGTWYESSFVVKDVAGSQRSDTRSLKRIFTYRYAKDVDVSVFEDCAWLRNVTWEPTFKLQLQDGTNTSYVLPAPYGTIGDAVEQAQAGIFPAGTQITILANPAPTGYYFDRWTGDVSALGPLAFDPNPTFLMPSSDLTLAATYSTNVPAAKQYPLTVIGGTGSGSYTNGTTVAIQANDPAVWYNFNGWTGDIATVDDPSSPATTILTSTNSLVVTATFVPMPIGSIIPAVLGIPSPVSTTNIPVNNVSLVPPAVQLGPIGDNEIAFFETVYTNAGTVIFPWSVDCEEGYDQLVFSVDGAPVASITGVMSGSITNFVAGDGPHVLRWAYIKDASDAAGADAGTVGAVTWIPDALAAEFGVPGKPLYFPAGADSVQLDLAPPAGAVSNVAAKIGGPVPVGNGEETAVEATFAGAGSLAFHWRTSSEAGRDYLIVSIDGVEAGRISGTKSGWLAFETNLLTVANHTVRWAYRKNSSTVAGQDCGWVDSVTWTQDAYQLTVENGSGDGSYAVGDTATITADAAPAGQEFDMWDGNTETVADLTSPTTTLVMPGRAITIRALYKAQTQSATVINGRDAGAWPNAAHESTGEPEGEYPAGTEVRIIADVAPLWQTFDHWVSTNGAVFADANADITTFTMPANDVTVTAVYRAQTEAEKLAGALTIHGQPLMISSFSSTGVVAEATGGIRYNDPVVKFGGPSVGAGQSASLTITNFTGDGVLLFWVSASAETAYDRIQVLNNSSVITEMISPKCGKWHASTNFVSGATSLTIRFIRDSSYFVRNSTILIDRVIWIPQGLINASGFPQYVPNINGEIAADSFSGEDGGVAWANDTPDSSYAIRFGRFGYVNNNQHAQLSITNAGTGVLTWDWASRSEFNYDMMELFVDEPDSVRWLSGKAGTWFSTYHVVTNLPGLSDEANRLDVHEFLFKYSKDSDVSEFEDCAWMRYGVWTPTHKLNLNSASNTFSLAAQFAAMPEMLKEAANKVFPTGAVVTVTANDKSPEYYFDSWAGDVSVLPPGGITSPTVTFTMPGHDVQLTATYTTNAPSPSPSAPAPARFTGLAVLPSIRSAQQAQGIQALDASTAMAQVTLEFECPAQTDYLLEWSPDLGVGQWQTLSILYREVLGDTATGGRLIRISAGVPAADKAQGFFRLQKR